MKTIKRLTAVLAAASVVGIFAATFSMGASAEGKDEPPYTAWLAASIGNDQQWNAGEWQDTTATINGDGSYTVSATIPEDGGSETIEYLSLETDINVYAFVEEGGDYKTEGTLKLVIDRIYVGHFDGSETELTYNGPGDLAYCTRDDGSSARMNILNKWGGATQQTTDIDGTIPGGIMAGETINIDFTVSGISAGGGTATTAPEENKVPDSTTTSATNSDGTAATTAAGATTVSGNNSSSNSSSNSSKGGSSNSSSAKNSTTSETGDFGIAAVVLGAIATAALGVGAYTVTKRKK